MIESLVVFSCLNGPGCNESSSAYYQTHPEIATNVELMGRRILDEKVIKLIVPLSSVYSGRFRINNHATIKVNSQEIKFIVEY